LSEEIIITAAIMKRVQTQLNGEDIMDWKFKCTKCGREQSMSSIIKQLENGEMPKRPGLIGEGCSIMPESHCYSPTCGWISYGDTKSGLLVVQDYTKPFDRKTGENCSYMFPVPGIDMKLYHQTQLEG